MKTWFRNLSLNDKGLPAWVEAGYPEYKKAIFDKLSFCLDEDKTGSYICTRTLGHSGDHVSHEADNTIMKVWI